jgi:hypothetical protein
VTAVVARRPDHLGSSIESRAQRISASRFADFGGAVSRTRRAQLGGEPAREDLLLDRPKILGRLPMRRVQSKVYNGGNGRQLWCL